MFGFAQLTARVSHWTVGGTLTVIMSGGIAGAVAALLFVVVERWLLPRTGPFVRGLAFGALTLGVASPGIRPPWPRTFALFAPAFLAFGLVFVHIHGRWSGGRRSWLSFIPVQGASSRLIERWICRSAR
jgi:hypothetical protein